MLIVAFPRTPLRGTRTCWILQNFRRAKSEWRSAIPTAPQGAGCSKIAVGMVSQQRLAWPSRRRLVLSRRARLLDAPCTSAGRPVSGPYGKKEQLSAARKPSPLGEGAERSEADEVRRGGSVTRPSRISHIPFSDVRLGGRPNPGRASGESLGRGLPLPPYLRDVPFMWTTLRKKDRLLCPPSTGRSPGKGTDGAPRRGTSVLHPRATSRIIIMRKTAMTPQVPPRLSWSWRRLASGMSSSTTT